MALNAAARSARSSEGPADDGTQGLSDALVDQEIVETVLTCGPVRTKPLSVRAQLVGDAEDFSRGPLGLECVPGAGLRRGDGRPVAMNELPHCFGVHRPILSHAHLFDALR